jgi:hypothetical protein
MVRVGIAAYIVAPDPGLNLRTGDAPVEDHVLDARVFRPDDGFCQLACVAPIGRVVSDVDRRYDADAAVLDPRIVVRLRLRVLGVADNSIGRLAAVRRDGIYLRA